MNYREIALFVLNASRDFGEKVSALRDASAERVLSERGAEPRGWDDRHDRRALGVVTPAVLVWAEDAGEEEVAETE